jgi:ankyrin repeat protein
MNLNYINDPDALVWATHCGVEEEFTYCLSRGDDVNVQDEHGRTPLHAAAEEGWTYLASILVERGADIHMKDTEGDTPLDYAIFHGHLEIAAVLRSHGAHERKDLSAKQKMEDIVYEGFESVDAARRLLTLIEEQKVNKAPHLTPGNTPV